MTHDLRFWTPPDLATIERGLSTLASRRPKQQIVTIDIPLLLRSRRKENAILQAQIIATNMTATILEALREDPTKPQYGKALTFIVKTYEANKQITSDLLANHLSAGFKKKDDSTTDAINKGRTFVEVELAGLKDLVNPEKFPLSTTLRTGVYRACAQMLLGWFAKIEAVVVEKYLRSFKDKKERSLERARIRKLFQQPTDWRVLHDLWAKALEYYEEAGNTIVPFGQHRGKPLREVGKRELRWLRSKILTPDEVEDQLYHLNILLRRLPHERDMQKQALRTNHLWQTTMKKQRRISAAYINQRNGKRFAQVPVKLRLMSAQQQERYHNELREAQLFAQDYARIRTDVDLFLDTKMPKYPTVYFIPTTKEACDALEQRYINALNKMARPWEPRLKSLDVAAEYERMERKYKEEYLKVAAEYSQKLQPLRFERTMRGKSIASFALLFTERTKTNSVTPMPPYTYLIVLSLHGKHASDFFTPERSGEGLRFVNYPYTPFVPSQQTSMLFAPIQCGMRQEYRHFIEIIKQQRERQLALFAEQSDEQPALIEECLPESAIGSAQITQYFTKKRHIRFVTHLHRSIQSPPLAYIPQAVIGFYEEDTTYFYVVIRLDGYVLSQGIVFIGADVLPQSDYHAYSNNFCYAIVERMIVLARQYQALIGIADMRWKRSVTLSHTTNRQRFRRPRAKIHATLRYKAILAGLLSPRIVMNISPKDCALCATLDNPETRKTGIYRDGFLVCNRCGTALPVDKNGALLVARRVLDVFAHSEED